MKDYSETQLKTILCACSREKGNKSDGLHLTPLSMVEFDTGLVLAIWTGAALPVFITFLAYWLSRRTEAKKLVRNRKEQVYRKFLWAIGDAVQALDDIRTLQLLKVRNPKDEDEIASTSFKLSSLPTIWTNPDAMETLRTVVMEGLQEEDGKARPKEVVEGIETLKSMFNVELAHVFFVSVKRVGRYSEEIGTFSLSPSLKLSMNKVFQLVSQKQYAVFAGGLLELAGLRGLDAGKDVDRSINEWNAALGELRTELDKDLKSAF